MEYYQLDSIYLLYGHYYQQFSQKLRSDQQYFSDNWLFSYSHKDQ